MANGQVTTGQEQLPIIEATDRRFRLQPEAPGAGIDPDEPIRFLNPPGRPISMEEAERMSGGSGLLDRFDAMFGGGGGGGGRGGRREGGGGGGGGGGGVGFTPIEVDESVAGDPEIQALLEDAVKNDILDETLLEADPELRERLLSVIDTIEDERGQLIQLDPETREQLATIRAGEIAVFEETLRQQQQDLLVNLFGRGQETSTIAGDVGQRLVVGSAAARAGIEAEAATREIDLRTALTAQSQQALQAQAQLLLGQQSQDFNDRQLLFQQQDARRTRNAQMLDAIYGRQTALEQTRVDSETRLQTATIGARAQLGAARISASAQVRSAGIAASASRFSSRLSAFIAGEQLTQRGAQFAQDIQLRRFLGESDIRLREQELRNQRDANRRSSRNSTLAGFAALAGGLALAFSDSRWKDNIRYTGNMIGDVPEATWTWKMSGQAGNGVIAQDVLGIHSDAIIQGPLGLMVDYSKLGE